MAMHLTCGVEVAGSDFGRESFCQEIFLTFLIPSRENLYG